MGVILDQLASSCLRYRLKSGNDDYLYKNSIILHSINLFIKHLKTFNDEKENIRLGEYQRQVRQPNTGKRSVTKLSRQAFQRTKEGYRKQKQRNRLDD
jgi:hypothetical protein